MHYFGHYFGIALGILALGTVLLISGDSQVSDEQAAQDHYCEMVWIWDKSKGEYGWPPYEGRETCK